MIDDPIRVDRVVSRLKDALPLSAGATSQLAAVIREQLPNWNAAQRCPVNGVDYAGDEGGIMCRLEVGDANTSQYFYVSITHLMFDHRSPLAREIAAYQKHRNKRLKRLHRMGLLEALDEQ